MPHREYAQDEGSIQPVVVLKQDPVTGKMVPIDALDIDPDGGLKVHVQNQSEGGGGGGVDPVSIKDGTDASRKLAVDASGRIQAVVSNLPETQAVSGTVAVSNLPSTQTVAGTVSVSNLPATQPVSLASVPSHAVTGTFWQATQPVSGPLTDAQLRATPVPISGTVAIGSGATYLYKGRASTLVTPGRAATTHTQFAIWNGSATRIIEVHLVGVDIYSTAIKAATVPPAVIRFYRTTTAPTNGVLLTKVPEDSVLSSDAGIVLRGDASADRTLAASALVNTPVAGALNQEYAPRLITAAGYELFDKSLFFETSPLLLRPNEGMMVRVEGPAATSIPATDFYITNIIWYER